MEDSYEDGAIALVVSPLEEKEELVLLDGYLVLGVGLWLIVVGGLENCEILVWFRSHVENAGECGKGAVGRLWCSGTPSAASVLYDRIVGALGEQDSLTASLRFHSSF